MPGIREKFVFNRSYRLLRHILFWLAFLVMFSFLSTQDLKDWKNGIVTAALNMPVNMLYAYVILLWLVPRFLVKGEYLSFFALYSIWGFLGMILSFAWRYYVLFPFRNAHLAPLQLGPAYRDVFQIFSFVVMNLMAIFAVFIRMFKYWYMEQQQKLQIEKEKVNAELELLKAQLHPHFLFNTLNNLYSLVLERSDKAPEMLMRLSALLNYVLYECKAPEVLLEKEIQVIKDYAALEQERYGDRLDISLNFFGDISGKHIVPMLFQPFVENAFKHGTSEQIGKVWMSIELSVKNDELFFRVINSVDRGADGDAEIKHGAGEPMDADGGGRWGPIGGAGETGSPGGVVVPGESFGPGTANGGIGIANVRRRLGLLYPEKYTLQHERGKDVYIVSLTIALNPAGGTLPGQRTQRTPAL